jgi:hypothetical protein
MTSTVAAIAIVTAEPGRPNHRNQFGNLSAAEGLAASTHSHPSKTNATVKSAACAEREGATVRCIRPSFLLRAQ